MATYDQFGRPVQDMVVKPTVRNVVPTGGNQVARVVPGVTEKVINGVRVGADALPKPVSASVRTPISSAALGAGLMAYPRELGNAKLPGQTMAERDPPGFAAAGGQITAPTERKQLGAGFLAGGMPSGLTKPASTEAPPFSVGSSNPNSFLPGRVETKPVPGTSPVTPSETQARMLFEQENPFTLPKGVEELTLESPEGKRQAFAYLPQTGEEMNKYGRVIYGDTPEGVTPAGLDQDIRRYGQTFTGRDQGETSDQFVARIQENQRMASETAALRAGYSPEQAAAYARGERVITGTPSVSSEQAKPIAQPTIAQMTENAVQAMRDAGLRDMSPGRQAGLIAKLVDAQAGMAGDQMTAEASRSSLANAAANNAFDRQYKIASLAQSSPELTFQRNVKMEQLKANLGLGLEAMKQQGKSELEQQKFFADQVKLSGLDPNQIGGLMRVAQEKGLDEAYRAFGILTGSAEE